jgi:uncharacterized protein (DUF433 family)
MALSRYDVGMFDRITIDPEILSGKPIIKGTRISVEFLLELAASGASRAEIVERYPQLSAQDVEQAFLYAGRAVGREEIVSLTVQH